MHAITAWDLKFQVGLGYTFTPASFTVTTVLALATLGGATKNRNDPIFVVLTEVAKASTQVTVACCCCWHYCAKTLPI